MWRSPSSLHPGHNPNGLQLYTVFTLLDTVYLIYILVTTLMDCNAQNTDGQRCRRVHLHPGHNPNGLQLPSFAEIGEQLGISDLHPGHNPNGLQLLGYLLRYLLGYLHPGHNPNGLQPQ